MGVAAEHPSSMDVNLVTCGPRQDYAFEARSCRFGAAGSDQAAPRSLSTGNTTGGDGSLGTWFHRAPLT